MSRKNDLIVSIIETLGGPSATAERLNAYAGNVLTGKAVSRWYGRDNAGIPIRYNHQLVAIGGEEIRQMLIELNGLQETKRARK